MTITIKFRQIFKNMLKKLNISYKLMFFSLVLMLIIFFIKFNQLPPQIPLFYSYLEGDNQIADLFMIFLLPLFSLLLISVNNLIYKIWFNNNFFVSKVVYYINITTIILLTFIFVRIIFLTT